MTDFLKSIGIVSSPADPAALLNQKEVDSQTQTIKTQLTSLFNSIDLSAKTGQLLGVPQAYVDKLNTLRGKTKSYIDMPNISPTELYNKLKGLDAEYKGLLTTQEKNIDNARLEKSRKAVDTVRARVKEIEADSTTSSGLREEYRTLLVDAEDNLKKMEVALAAAREVQVAAVKEGFQAAAGATDTQSVLSTLFPKIPMSPSFFETSPATILDRLEVLDLKKQDEESKVFSIARAVKRWSILVNRILWFITICIGSLLGGIMLTNFYVDEPFWGIKIFYFLVGAVLYPFVLLASVIKPPFYHSYLIPLVEIGAPAPAPPAPTPTQQNVQKGGAEDIQPNTAALTVENPSIGWFQSLYSYEPVTQAAIDIRLNSTKWPMRVAAIFGLVTSGSMMYWNGFFEYIINGEA
jgi:hypothetical protein